MKLTDALQGVSFLFLDTAPVIYQVERNPTYFDLVSTVFQEVDAGRIIAATSPVTLAECLVLPYRLGATTRMQEFSRLIVSGRNCRFIPIDQKVGLRAAELRARYNLLLPDALQVACGIESGCDAFLTNDMDLRRITELRVLVLDELKR